MVGGASCKPEFYIMFGPLHERLLKNGTIPYLGRVFTCRVVKHREKGKLLPEN